MTIDEVKRFIQDHRLKIGACRFNEKLCPEGALCLNHDSESNKWVVQLNERGTSLIRQEFDTETAACHFFLEKILSDPTYFIDFTGKDIAGFIDQGNELKKLIGVSEAYGEKLGPSI
jgi:hypothetical protein